MDDQDFPGVRHSFALWGVLLVIQRTFLTPLPLFIEPKVYVSAAPTQNISTIQEPVYADGTPPILGFEELDWLVPYLAVLLPIVACFVVSSGLAYLVRFITNRDNETPKLFRMAMFIWNFALRLAKNNPTVEAIRFLGRSLLQMDHGGAYGEQQKAKMKRTLLWNATLSVFPIAIAVLYLITVPFPNVDVSRWTGIPNRHLICSFVLVLIDIILLRAYFDAKGRSSCEVYSEVFLDGLSEEDAYMLPTEGGAAQSTSRRQHRQRKKAARQERSLLQDSDYEGDGESNNSQDSSKTKNQTDSSRSITARFLPPRTPKGAKVIKPHLQKPDRTSPASGSSSSKENTPAAGKSRDPLQEVGGRATAELSETRKSTPTTERDRQQVTTPAGFFGDICSFTFSPSAASTPVRCNEGQTVIEPLVLPPTRDGHRSSEPSLALTPTSGQPSLQVQQIEADTGRFTFRCSVPLREDGRILCSLPARPPQALLSPRLEDGRQDTWIPPQGLFIGANAATSIPATSNRGTKVLWSTIPPPQPAVPVRHIRRRLM